MAVRDDVLAVNYLMRQPITENEADRVLHALGLANYEVKKRPPEQGISATRKKARGRRIGPVGDTDEKCP